MSFVCFDCRLAVHSVEPSHLHAALVLGRLHQGAAPLPVAAMGRHQERRQTKDAAQRLLPATRHHTRVSFTPFFLVNIVLMFNFSYFLVEAKTVFQHRFAYFCTSSCGNFFNLLTLRSTNCKKSMYFL
jgi:hypothetical protein